MIKKILYWLMVVVIVIGAVYSYNKVDFARKTAMLFQTAFGDAGTMGGPAGGRPAMGGGQGQFQPGEGGSQVPPQMGQNMQGEQMPSGQSGAQGQTQMQGRGAGQFPDFQQGGEGSQRSNLQPGGRQGGPPGGMGQGPGGRISVREVIRYSFIFAFFVLLTYVIEKSIKRFSRSKTA